MDVWEWYAVRIRGWPEVNIQDGWAGGERTSEAPIKKVRGGVEKSDVKISSSGCLLQLLVYNNTASQWKPKAQE